MTGPSPAYRRADAHTRLGLGQARAVARRDTGLDFTSSLYLGFHHPPASLAPWDTLTTGKPAALEESTAAVQVARRVSQLQGCESGVLGRSTLHLFLDLPGVVAHRQAQVIYLDDGTYPVARWGVERAAGRGVPVRRFPHRDANALEGLLRREQPGRRPVVVTDGLCSGCGCAASLRAYLACVRQAGGLLVLDDTQALGLLGTRPNRDLPYGQGGGGSLRHQGIAGPDVVVVSSLAKAFGAPLALVSGSEALVRRFRTLGETRVHCSPPTAADIGAAARALYLNRRLGDKLRARLAGLVDRFRDGLAGLGVQATGGSFPVQTLLQVPGLDSVRLHQQLADAGIHTILRKACGSQSPHVSFILTARHRPEAIDQVLQVLAGILDQGPGGG